MAYFYFLGTCSVALALVLLGAACGNGNHCTGTCCAADCPCITQCPCHDGTTQTGACGPAACAEACSANGGAVDGGDGGDGG
jgi:hypothetical protein